MWKCETILLIFFQLLLLTYIFGYSRIIDPLVDTKLGLIRGLRANDGDYSMFMGIPFAKVEENNPFADAIPQEPFENIYEAYNDSAICPQIEEFNNTVTGTLDCLHLNVYVPNSASSQTLLPVLVYIYGGGFSIGFSGRYLYGPKYIVRHDVILVTLNYRVGPYGFMCLDIPEIPGNQGFKDQLLALRWIKENIEYFGGDANKITAFGNSAGAIAVDFHLLSQNLFSKVIINSGTTLIPAYPEPVKNAPFILAKHLGHDTDDMDDALLFLAKQNTNAVITATDFLNLKFWPCVEREFDNVDRFIQKNWINAVPKVKNMPIFIGNNNQETVSTHGLESAIFYENLIRDMLSLGFDVDNETFEGMEEIIRHFYIKDEPITNEVMNDIIDFDSDFKFNHPTFRSIEKYIENGAGNIFHYVFSYVGERNFVKYLNNITFGGAAHADELGYLFDMSFWKHHITDKDQLIVDQMTTMWTNFVKYSDPTPELTDLLPIKWSPITKGSPHHYLEINSELMAKTRPFSRRMAFWDLVYKMNNDIQRIYPGNNVI